MRGFLFSLAFMGLFLLALNPQFVVKIETGLFPSQTDSIETTTQKPAPSIETRVDILPEKPVIETPPPPPQKPASVPVVEKPVTPDPQFIPVSTPRLDPKIIPAVEKRSLPKIPQTDIPDESELPVLPNFDEVATDDDWIGETPCGIEIFDIPNRLANLGPRERGEVQTEPLISSMGSKLIGQPSYVFKSENGITLRVVEPLVEFYNVRGETYREAQDDIFSRKPLEIIRASRPNNSPHIKTSSPGAVTLADILSPTAMSYTLSGLDNRYDVVVDRTRVTSGFLITLPRWESYKTASTSDRAKWDDLLCNAAHHELGHLRIRLDILAETVDEYALFGTGSEDELADKIGNYREAVEASIQTRQDVYHIYNGGGLRRGMVELPYAELPFPWLETQN
ncbi:DUF922 domain-containing protein [Litorimonas sp. WD9-15]|uniref:DUF922 domain-containing protein n=1 Tax=Litorimonas sp. WD9-15 TaxID=3418716 RepID=UPI003D0867E7